MFILYISTGRIDRILINVVLYVYTLHDIHYYYVDLHRLNQFLVYFIFLL